MPSLTDRNRPAPSSSQPNGLPGRLLATSVPSAASPVSPASRITWHSDWPADVTATRPATVRSAISVPSVMAAQAGLSPRHARTWPACAAMSATVLGGRSGIVTGKIFLPNGPWFPATGKC